MVVSYFILNFLPLMILLALIKMMYVNRDVKIPTSNLFTIVVAMMFVITVISASANRKIYICCAYQLKSYIIHLLI